MALDRFVSFPEGEGPTPEQVELVVRNFFGDVAQVEWGGGRWTVSLPGEGTWALKGVEPDMTPVTRSKERWIEVCVGAKLDVLTRSQDEFTNALAAGLASLFARFWEGKVDDDT